MRDTTPEKRRRGAFPGERRGGRQRGSTSTKTASILTMAEAMGVDPLSHLLSVISCDGAMRTPAIDPQTGRQAVDNYGECLFQWTAVSLSERIAACRSIMSYLYPRLQSTQIGGPNGGVIQLATFDVTQLLNDPALARQAQRLALQIAEQQSDQNASQQPRPYDHYQPK